jgi:hypothetical protein
VNFADFNSEISQYPLVRRNRHGHFIIFIVNAGQMKLISNPLPRPLPVNGRDPTFVVIEI